MDNTWQIILISPYSNLYAVGLRHIAASLKADGWAVRLLFLPDPDELVYRPQPHNQAYPADVLEQVAAFCQDASLVGLSVMTNFVERAALLTHTLQQRVGVPVIWGGIHPTVRPEESLQWADYVCVGEGEDAIVDLVRALAAGTDTTHVPNIWAKRGGEIFANPVRPLRQDIDALPLPDYELSTQFILHDGQIRPLTPHLLAHYLSNDFGDQPRIAYMTYSTRGCPYRCTYCCDSSLADMYADWRLLRRRSPENLIAEINHARRLLPGLQAVVFMDSTFLAVRLAEIRRFSDLYRAQVGLPFFVMGTPGSISEEKISCLVEAGLRELEMGIQSGSAAVRRQFHRFETNDTILKAARILRRYQPPLSRPTYDLISDNPYETAADKLETLRLLYRLPRPYALNMFSLNFFPGTEMHRRAQADGLLPDETAVYRKNLVQLQPTYYNFALWAFHRGLPRPLLWLLLQPRLLQWGETVLQRPFRLLFQLITRQRARHTRRNSRAQLARLAAQPAHSPPEHETAPTGAAA